MNNISAESGSFRDPAGRVYRVGDRIFRTVTDYFADDFDIVNATGLPDKLVKEGLLLPAIQVDKEVLQFVGAKARYVLEIPRLQFVSFPYEWSFSALKAAALLHLEIHLTALEHGVTLSDSSAYNVQFQGANPIFIDHLSFRPYQNGELWVGHRQFCEQFLNPLLLRAFLGIAHNAWYRGTQEGIMGSDLSRLLKWRHKCNWNALLHVVMPSIFQKTAQNKDVGIEKGQLPTSALPLLSFQRMLQKLHSWIAKLEPADTGKTIWQDYAKTHSYTSHETEQKKRFVSDFANRIQPRLVWDLGCNVGEYSSAALAGGAKYVVGFDFDQGALDVGFHRARENNLSFQALYLDAANPPPNQGWREQEREGLQARAAADGVLALAFIHHLAIARNIPLDQLVQWIVGLAPAGVIEFVPKQDPMVKNLLRLREDIFPDYTEAYFLDAISKQATIVKKEIVSKSGRLLIDYTRL